LIRVPRLWLGSIAVVALALSATACRAPRSVYGPTGDNVGSAPEGHPAAIYEVPLGTTKGGQVQVWSRGVVFDERDGAASPEAPNRARAFEVGFIVRNDSPSQITIQPLEVHLILDDMPPLRPRESRAWAVDPGKTEELLLHYPLPGRFEERGPNDYQVSWVLHFATGTFKETTTFSRQTERGFVPQPLDSSGPADRPIMEGERQPQPFGLPFGADPNR